MLFVMNFELILYIEGFVDSRTASAPGNINYCFVSFVASGPLASTDT